jgi:hypothetical protein
MALALIGYTTLLGLGVTSPVGWLGAWVGCPRCNLLVVERIKPRTFKPNGMTGAIDTVWILEFYL